MDLSDFFFKYIDQTTKQDQFVLLEIFVERKKNEYFQFQTILVLFYV